ncbi:AraC family transcriptional regulator, partial [Desulfosarcina sp. OttesenSCG-928-G10]|nr:AraC family transcriptional regulator [Desulfosarcina sp. OttesenSCG-928-G10]
SPEISILQGDPAHFSMSAETIRFSHDFEGMQFSIEQPRSGMSVFMCRGVPIQNIAVPFAIVDDGTLTFAVVLSGFTDTQYASGREKTGGGYRLDAAQPQNIIFASADCEGIVHMNEGRPQCYVGIHIPLEQLQELLDASALDAVTRNRRAMDGNVHLVRQMPSDPHSRLTASQILSCPLTGCCRRLFMEGKCLELLSALLSQISGEKKSNPPESLKQGDVERLHEARRILLEKMDEPPGLRVLSRQCGINEFKLKKGFRELFGCTPYEALRSHRMHVARTLLLGSGITVSTAAATVGYTNTSHFITAFRKEFGITPGVLIAGSRRSTPPAVLPD